MAGIIANKIEMTRIVKGDKFIPVTLLRIPKSKVIGFKTLEKDGYESIIVGVVKKGIDPVLGEGKNTLNKSSFSTIAEFVLSKEEKEKYNVGDSVDSNLLSQDLKVSVSGFSKGKGFTGAMKKHNFHGGPKTHGSKFHRALGSIGTRKPVRTYKGRKMHGHHGNSKITIKNIPVELINKEINVIALRGGIPGARNSILKISF